MEIYEAGSVAAVAIDSILEGLRKPFPKEAVKERVGAGGKRFKYVQTHAVINRLNSVARCWDWDVVSEELLANNLIKVKGVLTIPGIGRRMGTGVQQLQGGEDLHKGGESDALKNAAKKFGVAIELYGPDYEDDEAPVKVDTPTKASSPKPQTKEDPRNSWRPCGECGKLVYWRIQPDNSFIPYEEDSTEHYHVDEAPAGSPLLRVE